MQGRIRIGSHLSGEVQHRSLYLLDPDPDVQQHRHYLLGIDPETEPHLAYGPFLALQFKPVWFLRPVEFIVDIVESIGPENVGNGVLDLVLSHTGAGEHLHPVLQEQAFLVGDTGHLDAVDHHFPGTQVLRLPVAQFRPRRTRQSEKGIQGGSFGKGGLISLLYDGVYACRGETQHVVTGKVGLERHVRDVHVALE